MNPVRIGHYLIERRVGAGGMGNVYLARHEQTREQVAVKELPASLAREEGFVHRFNREIEAMKMLNNPHIVKLFESGYEDGTYFYAMEYVDGETLTTRLRRDRRIPWREAVEISRQICVGLKHAHDSGVIHRDLKPSNLMISKDGAVKIADFGVAQVFAADRLTITGGIIGTAEFMSPEQVKGSRIDKRSDLYSLGAVLYTMLVGQPPFTGASASDIMQKQRFGSFDPPRKYDAAIPSWLDTLVCQLLEKDPANRPPDAFVTAKRLQEIVKKVELQQESQESALHSTTVGLTRVDDNDTAQPQLGATFVRDIMRAEMVPREPTSLPARLLNSTWVLISLLILVSVGLVWAVFRTMNATSIVDDEALAKTEAERIVQRARWRWKKGRDPVAALSQLEALESVIKTDATQKDILRSVETLRAAIRVDMNTPDQLKFVERALERADSLAETDREAARQICNGVISLYKSDRRLEHYVEQARLKLQSFDDSPEQSP